MNDTDRNIATRYREMLMSLPPGERLRCAAGMFSDAKKLVEMSIRHKQKALSEAEIKIEIFKRFYACDFSASELANIISHLAKVE